jgi:mediator of RNA polymerase II transcription subunit 28
MNNNNVYRNSVKQEDETKLKINNPALQMWRPHWVECSLGRHPAPPPPQGFLIWASLLQAAPGALRSFNSTSVDELESSFEARFASLVCQDYVNDTDQEEIRTGVHQCVQKFLDIGRQTEYLFLQKRLQLYVPKSEQVMKEDVSELRNELQWKDALLQKHLQS